jgi:hypothetical protein
MGAPLARLRQRRPRPHHSRGHHAAPRPGPPTAEIGADPQYAQHPAGRLLAAGGRRGLHAGVQPSPWGRPLQVSGLNMAADSHPRRVGRSADSRGGATMTGLVPVFTPTGVWQIDFRYKVPSAPSTSGNHPGVDDHGQPVADLAPAVHGDRLRPDRRGRRRCHHPRGLDQHRSELGHRLVQDGHPRPGDGQRPDGHHQRRQ